MRLPLSSLRANLIAAFLAVIAVSLLLASTAFAYLLREYQVERETDRLGNIAAVYMAQVVRMARSGATLQVISSQLDQSADDSDLRVLLLDDHGQVLHDTDNNRFVGRTFVQPPSQGRRSNVAQFIEDGTVLTVASFPPEPRFQPGLRIAVASPEQSLTNAWRDVLPRLSLAALSALLVDVFHEKGLSTDVAGDVIEAKRLLARNDYRVVLLDFILPDGNGSDVIDFIKAQQMPQPVSTESAVDSRRPRQLCELRRFVGRTFPDGSRCDQDRRERHVSAHRVDDSE